MGSGRLLLGSSLLARVVRERRAARTHFRAARHAARLQAPQPLLPRSRSARSPARRAAARIRRTTTRQQRRAPAPFPATPPRAGSQPSGEPFNRLKLLRSRHVSACREVSGDGAEGERHLNLVFAGVVVGVSSVTRRSSPCTAGKTEKKTEKPRTSHLPGALARRSRCSDGAWARRGVREISRQKPPGRFCLKRALTPPSPTFPFSPPFFGFLAQW
jgi:hypothetical protein